MWSWSQPSRTGTVNGGSRTSSYPATRRGTAANYNATNNTSSSSSQQQQTQMITRSRHIESYLKNSRLEQSTRRVSSDHTNSSFDTVFLTKGRATLCLRVYVPFGSNASARNQDLCPAPVMTLVGVKAQHPWLDGETMRVNGNTYQPLRDDNSWIRSGLMLGQAVCSVVEHLQLNPPLVLEFTDRDLAAQNGAFVVRKTSGFDNGNASNASSSNPPSYNAAITDIGWNSNSRYQTTHDYHDPFPKNPEKFSELESMNREEMQILLNDEDAFLEYVNKSFKKPVEVLEKFETNNFATAKKTLGNKEKLMSLSADVVEMRSSLREKLEIYEPLEKRYTKVCMPPSVKGVLKKLNNARREASVSSDKIVDKFANGDLDVNNYIEQFMEKRKLFHERSAKIERLQNTKI